MLYNIQNSPGKPTIFSIHAQTVYLLDKQQRTRLPHYAHVFLKQKIYLSLIIHRKKNGRNVLELERFTKIDHAS